MGWMKAIATDVEDLKDAVRDSEPEALPDRIRDAGWVSPTEAVLISGLVQEVLEPGTLNEADAGRLRRVLDIIGSS